LKIGVAYQSVGAFKDWHNTVAIWNWESASSECKNGFYAFSTVIYDQ